MPNNNNNDNDGNSNDSINTTSIIDINIRTHVSNTYGRAAGRPGGRAARLSLFIVSCLL